MASRKAFLLKLMNFWPPFLGAGIHVDFMSKDYHRIVVSMKLRFWNRNYVNTHYGGSLYSMTDPFYMLMLMQILGRDFLIWDKAASIRFKKPGLGKVSAVFELSSEQIESFKNDLKTKEKIEPVLTVLVRDEAGSIVAEVEKVLFIKNKN
ncbi:MAG: DUF4442 domain-containing protein [Bacteriovorax sp.]|nr:DUF4442 domain-containing protein [Bacteriovorax sp.]